MCKVNVGTWCPNPRAEYRLALSPIMPIMHNFDDFSQRITTGIIKHDFSFLGEFSKNNVSF